MSEAAADDLSLLSLDDLLRRRRALRRVLAAREPLTSIRIGILGGSTASELLDLLELRLLADGFWPEFFETAYGQHLTAAVYDAAELERFRPQIIFVHTGSVNLAHFPPPGAGDDVFRSHLDAELMPYRTLWRALAERIACPVVQNNFELPAEALLGNLDALDGGGRTRFVLELNRAIADEVRRNPRLILQDVCGMSARLGVARWFDRERWFTAKIATTPEASDALARSLAAICRALHGRVRKVLVLDLDNTLWGGVIGEDGPERIALGSGDALAEAYTAFQRYCLRMRERGVLLAVCSKNDEAVALTGLSHPESVLRREHFASFQANWETKPENLLKIARELNLGVDSLVFVDDNAAERALVRAQMPQVAVPEVGDDVTRFTELLERERYFEQVALSAEDLARADAYRALEATTQAAGRYADYGEYLDSLEMVAEIAPIPPGRKTTLARVVQLTNKTNQFNLTGKRYTLSVMEETLADPQVTGLAGRLRDRFAEHGLISVILGRREGFVLAIELWLMSCRVLKRGMEEAMLDVLVSHALGEGVEELRGEYVPTGRNAMVADLYARLGFQQIAKAAEGRALYRLALRGYTPRNQHIHLARDESR